MLCDAKDVSFPLGDPDQFVNDFGNFFVQKIERINKSLADLSVQSQSPPHADKHSACADGRFTSFKSLMQDHMRMLTDKVPKKSCQLDPVPTSIVVQLLDILAESKKYLWNMYLHCMKNHENPGGQIDTLTMHN